MNSLMEGVRDWTSFYRANPHRLAKDYLHLNLTTFQKIMLVQMNSSTTTVFIGSRGIGKTFLSAVFCVIKCILYPGTQVVVASKTKAQGYLIIEKIITELVPRSKELEAELDLKKSTLTPMNPKLTFKNHSFIKVVTSSDSARGNRATLLLLDEYRLIDYDAINTILRKFLTIRRNPPYEKLTREEKKKALDKEKNSTIYLSSAYWSDHWSYAKFKDTYLSMLDDKKKQFACALPYQLSIAEGLLDPDLVAEEMNESNFSEIKFSMEYEALFYGMSDGAFFDFNSVSKNRKITYPYLPEKIQSKLPKSTVFKIPRKEPGEIRILSADIALMSSGKYKNDATAVHINFMTPTKSSRYMSNIVYTDTFEGLRTDEQALMIRRLFDEYECDHLVLDTQGIGLGVFDALSREMVDSDTGEIYPALSCSNNAEMASRCTDPNAEKVIYSIKASAQFNSDCAFLLREGFRSGRIRLLKNEYDAEENLKEVKGFNELDSFERLKFELPFINTTLLIDELTKLQHEEAGGRIRVREKNGMRKDRYSSLAYNYYLATQIESKLYKKNSYRSSSEEKFMIRVPKSSKGKGGGLIGKSGKQQGWAN